MSTPPNPLPWAFMAFESVTNETLLVSERDPLPGDRVIFRASTIPSVICFYGSADASPGESGRLDQDRCQVLVDLDEVAGDAMPVVPSIRLDRAMPFTGTDAVQHGRLSSSQGLDQLDAMYPDAQYPILTDRNTARAEADQWLATNLPNRHGQLLFNRMGERIEAHGQIGAGWEQRTVGYDLLFDVTHEGVPVWGCQLFLELGETAVTRCRTQFVEPTVDRQRTIQESPRPANHPEQAFAAVANQITQDLGIQGTYDLEAARLYYVPAASLGTEVKEDECIPAWQYTLTWTDEQLGEFRKEVWVNAWNGDYLGSQTEGGDLSRL